MGSFLHVHCVSVYQTHKLCIGPHVFYQQQCWIRKCACVSSARDWSVPELECSQTSGRLTRPAAAGPCPKKIKGIAKEKNVCLGIWLREGLNMGWVWSYIETEVQTQSQMSQYVQHLFVWRNVTGVPSLKSCAKFNPCRVCPRSKNSWTKTIKLAPEFEQLDGHIFWPSFQLEIQPDAVKLVLWRHWMHLSYVHPVTSENQFHCTRLYCMLVSTHWRDCGAAQR